MKDTLNRIPCIWKLISNFIRWMHLISHTLYKRIKIKRVSEFVSCSYSMQLHTMKVLE